MNVILDFTCHSFSINEMDPFKIVISSVMSVSSLVRQIFKYSRDNLALVNVYIKNPVVTKIR